MANRFFAFGCSMTRYLWPTWADLLAINFDEYQNWGKSGGGNRFIFESISEAIVTQDLNKDDTVWVMWSGPHRFDTYRNDVWQTEGNIYYSNWTKYLDVLWDEKGFHLHTFNFIKAAKLLLDNVGCKYQMASMVDLTGTHDNNENKTGSIISNYQELQDYESLFDDFIETNYMSTYQKYEVPDKFWKQVTWSKLTNKKISDHHPQPMQALQWLSSVINKNRLQYDVDIDLANRFQTVIHDQPSYSKMEKEWDRYRNKLWEPVSRI